MIIRGAHKIDLASGGAGFAVLDSARPDLGPTRPGYLKVTGISASAVGAPWFVSVTAADGVLSVIVAADPPVDEYHIAAVDALEVPAAWWTTTSGEITETVGAGPYYLAARAVYQGAYSAWIYYGQALSADDEWRLVWEDTTINSGTLGTFYPYATPLIGNNYRYSAAAGFAAIVTEQPYPYGGTFIRGISRLYAEGGACGVRFDTRLRYYPAADIDKGFIWGFDPVAMAAAPTTTPYYALVMSRDPGYYIIRLLHGVGTTVSQLAVSGSISDHVTLQNIDGFSTNYIDLQFTVRGNVFSASMPDGTILLPDTSDLTIPLTPTTTGAGLYHYILNNAAVGAVHEGYMRVWARDHDGTPEVVTPGSAQHNDLDGRSIADCHPMAAITGLSAIHTDTAAPTGIVDRTKSTISFVSATKVFTIAPASGTFDIYSAGTRYSKGTCTTTLGAEVGLHYVYFTSAGVLANGVGAWDITGSGVPVAIIYWNGTAGTLSDERHSAGRNLEWHEWAHKTIGTRYDYGLSGTFTSAASTITAGNIYDEDLDLGISGQTSVRLWYRASGGAAMTFDVAGSATSAKITGGALQYDSGGTLTAIDSAKYCTNWLYATGDTALPIYCVVSQSQYATIALARAATMPTFPNMPTAELKLIYRVIWQNSGGTPAYVEATDYRSSSTLPAGGTSAPAASSVSFSPTGAIAATNVQTALEELDAEKSAASHTHVGADVTTAVASATNADTLDTLHATSFLQVAPNQTISIPSGSTAAQINALIAAVPKYIPYGSTVVFQFADGTYTLNATLSFSGFLGGGSIVLYGNLGEANATVAHTTQAVHLDFSATNCEGLFFYGNKCNVGIYNLRISAISNTSSRRCVYFQQCHTVGLCYSYLLGTNNTGTNTGACVLVTDCAGGIIVSCYFSFHVYGIYANRTALSSATNSSVAGSEPCYGLYVSAAQLRKTSTQPAGSVAAEATTSGGQIIGTETWWTSANDGSGTGLDADTVDGVHASSMVQNATTRTVNFTSTMTAAEINALIAAVPKYVPYGQTLTFQFGDGTYTLTAPLYFNGFNGAGSVYIYGNTTEAGATTLHTTQQVILDFSATACHGVYLSNTRCYTIIRNLKIITKSEVATQYGLYIELCPYVLVYYNYVLGTGYAAGYAGCCITVTAGAYARILYNYVSANTYGITVSNANAQSDRNESTGASLLYGLYAYGSLILKYGTQPAGSTANELIARGGQIISSDKYWTDANDGTGSGLDADTVDGVHASTILQIGGSVTVNLASTMTTAEIQAAINAVPRYLPYGAAVVFQFAAGTYTLTAALEFIGFLGGGTVTIQGNRSEANASVLHTTQDVHLDFSGTSCHGIYIQECKCTVNVYNLKISNVSNASSYRALQVRKSTYVSFAYNYLLGTSAAAGASSAGILVTEGSKAALTANYLGLNTYGVIAGNTSEIYSSGNDDVAGSLPVYGLYAGSSTIYKVGTQPNGTSVNELTADGGQIRGAEKYWTDANDGTGSGLDADSVDGTHLSGLCAWKGALASAPGTPAEGWIYYNTGDSKTYIYANAGWKALT